MKNLIVENLFKKFAAAGLILLLLPLAYVAAKKAVSVVVMVDGAQADVRVIDNQGTKYVAAPDIAKALGKEYAEASDGTLMFGSSKAGELVEYGKWGFNGKARVRVAKAWRQKKPPDPSYPYPYRVTLEFANGMKEPLSLHYVRCEWFSQGSFTEITRGDEPEGVYGKEIKKGSETTVTYELHYEPDYVTVEFNPADWRDYYSPYYDFMISPMMKLKTKP